VQSQQTPAQLLVTYLCMVTSQRERVFMPRQASKLASLQPQKLGVDVATQKGFVASTPAQVWPRLTNVPQVEHSL
jgi:hypothetical protein